MRVLLVEDDRKAARVLKKGLEEEGLVVDVAHGGDQGEELAAVTAYDVMVLDWLLPGLPGIEVCRRVPASQLATPVTYTTGFFAVQVPLALVEA
jgi:DNA-binding response OmpR family regulator